MKCCGSPTTFTALSSPAAPQNQRREAAAQLNALLFAEVFKPLSKALGFYGDVAVGAAARATARAESGGLTDRLEAAFASASRTGMSGPVIQ